MIGAKWFYQGIPNDVIPIKQLKTRKFQVFTQYFFVNSTPSEPTDFNRRIKKLIRWKQLVIRNFYGTKKIRLTHMFHLTEQKTSDSIRRQ